MLLIGATYEVEFPPRNYGTNAERLQDGLFDGVGKRHNGLDTIEDDMTRVIVDIV